MEVGPGVPELHRELEVSLTLFSNTVRGFVSKHIVEHSGGRGEQGCLIFHAYDPINGLPWPIQFPTTTKNAARIILYSVSLGGLSVS